MGLYMKLSLKNQKSILSAATIFALSYPMLSSAQTVSAVMQSGLRILDPAITTVNITNYHGYMVYDTLVSLDSNYEVQPQMAEWEVSDDGREYVFTLREGLKWHDGEPVTSEDCVASILRWSEQDKMGQMLMPMVEELSPIDENSFKVVLEEPTPLLLQSLSKIGGPVPFMMPKRLAETPSTEQIKEQIGSGPFKFVANEYQPNIKAVYEKNEDYVPRNEPADWLAGGKVVNIDRVEWVTMPDQMTALNSLINGEIDYMEAIPYDLLAVAESDDDLEVRLLNQLGLQSVYRFNFLHPPFDNPIIRQAAMHAVGQEDVMHALVGNPDYYTTCGAVFGCGGPFDYEENVDWLIEPNIEEARQLLKEGGYDGTPVVLLHATDNPLLSAQPIVIAEALREAGFTVDLQSMDWQTLASRRTSTKQTDEGGWSIFVTFWPLTDLLDPIRYPAVAANGEDAWFGWPDIPEIEELRYQFTRLPDYDSQKELMKELQNLVLEEGVVVPSGQYLVPAAYRTNLENVLEAPIAAFWNLTKNTN